MSKQFIYGTIAHVWLGFKWVYRIMHHLTFTTLIYSFLFFIKRLQKYKNAPIINKQAAFLYIAQISIYGLLPLPSRCCFMTGYPYFSTIICRFYSIIPMILFIFPLWKARPRLSLWVETSVYSFLHLFSLHYCMAVQFRL